MRRVWLVSVNLPSPFVPATSVHAHVTHGHTCMATTTVLAVVCVFILDAMRIDEQGAERFGCVALGDKLYNFRQGKWRHASAEFAMLRSGALLQPIAHCENI